MKPEYIIIVVAILAIGGTIASLIGTKLAYKNLLNPTVNEHDQSITRSLTDNNFIVSACVEHELIVLPVKAKHAVLKFLVDNVHKRFAIISYSVGKIKYLNYEEIIGVDIVEKNELTHNILNNNTSQRFSICADDTIDLGTFSKSPRYEYIVDLNIRTNNFSESVFTIQLIQSDPSRKNALKFANEVKTIITNAIGTVIAEANKSTK